MTRDDVLKRLEELEAEATKAPWFASPTPRDSGGWSSCTGVAGVGGGKPGMIYASPPNGVFPSADKELIIEARNHLPSLLTLIRAQQAEIEAWRTSWVDGDIILHPMVADAEMITTARAATDSAWKAVGA